MQWSGFLAPIRFVFSYFLLDAIFQLLLGALHQASSAVFGDPQRFRDHRAAGIISEPHPQRQLRPIG